jgi:hypothetical protein
MPKNPVTDPITHQEIAFARPVLSGTMSDRQAAEAAGLNPDSAAYTKSKPRVRAYMLEHRAPPPNLAEQESAPEPQPAPPSAEAPHRIAEPTPLEPSQPASPLPGIPGANFVPDTRVPFSIKRNPFAHRL